MAIGINGHFFKVFIAKQRQVELDLTVAEDIRHDKLSEGVAFWGDDPDVWESITIANTRFPGNCRLKGKIADKKDRKSKPGGTTISTHYGYAPAEVEITLRLWTADHWSLFQNVIVPLVRPKPNAGPPAAYEVSHPALEVYGITKLEFIEADLPCQSGEVDIYEVNIKAREWLPPVSKVTTNTAAVAIRGNDLTTETNKRTGTTTVLPPSKANAGPKG